MASVYLVLKLEGMNPQYCTGFENAYVCVCRGVKVSHSLIAVGAVGVRVPLYLGHS